MKGLCGGDLRVRSTKGTKVHEFFNRRWTRMNSEQHSRNHIEIGFRSRSLDCVLRAHGLIRKQPKVNRYVLRPKGREFAAALMTASALEAKVLMDIAA